MKTKVEFKYLPETKIGNRTRAQCAITLTPFFPGYRNAPGVVDAHNNAAENHPFCFPGTSSPVKFTSPSNITTRNNFHDT